MDGMDTVSSGYIAYFCKDIKCKPYFKAKNNEDEIISYEKDKSLIIEYSWKHAI